MFDLILLDGESILAQIIIILSAIIFIFFAMSKLRFQEYRMAEYFALYPFCNSLFSIYG